MMKCLTKTDRQTNVTNKITSFAEVMKDLTTKLQSKAAKSNYFAQLVASFTILEPISGHKNS